MSYLNLLHSEIQEGEVRPHWDDRLGPLAAHGGPQASVEFDDHQLVEQRRHGRLVGALHVGVGDNLHTNVVIYDEKFSILSISFLVMIHEIMFPTDYATIKKKTYGGYIYIYIF